MIAALIGAGRRGKPRRTAGASFCAPVLLVLSACGTDGVTVPGGTVTETLEFATHTVAGTSAAAPARIPATLHLPDRPGRVPAVVILPSSSGVQEYRETYYARALAEAGIAALVVDSFRGRGVVSALEDQTAVTSFQLENDAFAALGVLHTHVRIDTTRIAVMGVSKGGTAALNAAFLVRENWRRTALRFAAHIAISPACEVQHRSTATTGTPLLMMLAGLDDFTPAHLCREYAHAIGQGVRLLTYAGAHHGWERPGPVVELTTAENFSRCPAIMEDDGTLFVAALGRAVSTAAYLEHARSTCVYRGNTHAGGGSDALRQQAVRDLIAFLRDAGF